MRELLYVPIIHGEADLGSIASIVNKRSAQLCGEERWNKHKKTVTLFWNSIAEYFESLDAINLKIYQDGLIADVEIGRKIIEEGARRGSKNYQIVLNLIERGGEIRKTEDVALLKEEYERIIKLAQTKSLIEKTLAYIGYRFHKGRLIEERDEFIASAIDKTLKDGETGVLFLGTYHEVLSLLPKDIRIKEVKNREKMKAYFKELIYGRDEGGFEQLAEYLASPV